MKIIILTLLYFSGLDAKLDTEWWKHTNIYEIILYSYKDSDGDGIGDLKGLNSKLDYLHELGVECIYLTPIYETTMFDMGYDVSNHLKIDRRYGTMEDFEELVKQMNSRGMKLIMDLVINHSSNEHEWFKKSIDKIEPYTDYYIWANPRHYLANGTNPVEPNNWSSMFGGSSWKWNEKRQQFYYHIFLKEQPDLNLRNDNVKAEVKNIIKFWLDKGISGIRLDAVLNYMEDKYLREADQWRIHHPDNYRFLRELRIFLDQYNREHGSYERIFAAEVHTSGLTLANYYGTKDYPLCHLTFYASLSHVNYKLNAISYDAFINSQLQYLSDDNILAWVYTDHDRLRLNSRISPEYNDLFVITVGLLPGTVVNYYGVEIGLRNGFLQNYQRVDWSGRGTRDPNRLPMQWDDSLNAGFSTNETVIITPNTDYNERNVKFQKAKKISHYNVLKTINDLRKMKTIKYGKFESTVYSPKVYIFWRIYENRETYIVVINFDEKCVTVDFSKIKQLGIRRQRLTVVVASINADYEKGDIISRHSIQTFQMNPLSCVVFKTIENHRMD